MVDEKKNTSSEEKNENTDKMDEDGSKMSNKSNIDTSRTSESSDEDDEGYNDESDDEDDDNSDDSIDQDMPLFKYARLMDSLPRAGQEEPHSIPIISPNCSSTTMGKGSCSPPPKSATLSSLMTSSSLRSSMNNAKASMSQPQELLGLSTTTPPQEEVSFPVLAVGLKNGAIHLLDLQTGLTLLNPNQPQLIVSSNIMKKNNSVVKYDEKKDPIVSMSFDASGRYMAACRLDGDMAIFELKYRYASHQKNDNDINDTGISGMASSAENMLTSLFGPYKQPSQPSNSTTKTPSQDKASSSTTYMLQRTLDSTNLSDTIRFSYATPISKPKPTCIVLDPSYESNREKSWVAGFQDGRVMLTKQGFFGRFNQTVLYTSSDGGIENITWRGSLLAWADTEGILLYDLERTQRFRKFRRPTGARASLYPTISSLRPYLLYDTSSSLIIAWGDCFMSIHITEALVQSPQEDESKIEKNETNIAPVIIRRDAILKKSWELDCVACGIQPIDEDHIAILGLISNKDDETDAGYKPNTLQLQIVHRNIGTISSADALVLHNEYQENNSIKFIESASNYSLLSSFALPRMEDKIEMEAEAITALSSGLNNTEDSILNPLGGMGGNMLSSSNTFDFLDSHLRWSISSVLTRSDDIPSIIPEDEDEIKTILNMPKKLTTKKSSETITSYSPPPIMVISSPFDMILVRTRNIEDTITHYRNKEQPRLALSLGIQHKQILRRHSLSSLIHDYLTFLMNGGDGSKKRADFVNHAARLTPMLLGADVETWERWLTIFAKVEGGLFALRDFIPVRDPKLSPQSYEMVLQKMLIEVEAIANSPTSTPRQIDVAKRIYLNTLLAWGPTDAIVERYQRHGSGVMKDQIGTEIFMRMQQTSKRYLKGIALALPKEQFEMWRHKMNMKEGGTKKRKTPGMMMRDSSQNKRYSKGSLYDVSSVTSYLMERLPFSNEKNREVTMSNEVGIVLFEAVSDLHYIARNYREALRLLLVVGASLCGEEKINMIEENAVKSVISPDTANLEIGDDQLTSYEYIFAIMEYHNLHRYLLDESFVPQVDIGNNEPDPVPPIVALIRLVGLKLTGDFLVNYCTLPTFTALSKKSNPSSAKENKTANDESSSYLPITAVSNQLQTRPKLLFWYLNLVFVHRQELYVNLPNTSVAPSVITDLHRKHFDLFLDFSEEDEPRPLEAEMKPEVDTPMILFMKTALRHGGIRSAEVRQRLEEKRSEKRAPTSIFARELAYIIERTGQDLEEDARTILQLHLEGSRSLLLAVAYAERNTTHSAMLWDMLVSHCLKKKAPTSDTSTGGRSLFQALLETAAQCGADLAHLVSQIPEGMQIDGLRSMLLAAVADYTLKLKMHESSADIMTQEKVGLLREIAHRSRRGLFAVSASLDEEKDEIKISKISNTTKIPFEDEKGTEFKIRKNIKHHKMRLESERHARLRPIRSLPFR